MRSKWWDDFEVGQRVQTDSLTVTEAHVVNFAGLTGDYYPLHMDAVYAGKTQFKQQIAHGPLVFSLAVGLVGQTRVFADSLVAFLGVDRMKLTAPVFFGDTISVRVEVISKKQTSNPGRGITTMRYHVFNQEGVLVLECDMNFMMHVKEELQKVT